MTDLSRTRIECIDGDTDADGILWETYDVEYRADCAIIEATVRIHATEGVTVDRLEVRVRTGKITPDRLTDALAHVLGNAETDLADALALEGT